MAIEADSREVGSTDPRFKSAVRGAVLGFFVDMFDLYLPIVVLAPALIYFVSPEIDETTKTIIGAFIFATALIGRPVGALIFGGLADSIGRRRTTIISISGFGAVTLLLALMPGYQYIGIAAPIIFIILRFVDGVFIGGEYSAANPLAMEYSPREKRGYYGGMIIAAFPFAYACISVITMILLFIMPSEGINSPYVQWGWRIPFVIGAALSFAFVLYYVRYVSESELWEGVKRDAEARGDTSSPLRRLFQGENLKDFLQVFVLMSGLWFIINPVFAILPGLLSSEVGLSSTNATIALVIMSLVMTGAYWAAGAISQRTGRRTFFMFMAVFAAVGATSIYYVLLSTTPQNLFVVTLMIIGIAILSAPVWGVGPTYVNERFHTGVRASAYGLGYSLAVIIPSFYALYQAGLAQFMPSQYTVLVLLVIGSILIFVGAAWGPETKDVDFSQDLKAFPEQEKSPVGGDVDTQGVT
ncbi:MAG TPA: MFS transporter [Rubrobacteraceae bacterium]|jgi:MFS family permease|nr:MFS transporter [Rubrobacteraceae bacterium]